MKMMKNKYLLIAGAMICSFASCSKDFVDIEPQGQFLTANYYKDQTQAFGALVGVYDVLRKNSGGFENMITMMNAGSDDHYAGGGDHDDPQSRQGAPG